MKRFWFDLMATFIENKTNRIEEMLKRVMPETGIEQGEMLKYVEDKLDEIENKDMDIHEMYSRKDWDKLSEFCMKDSIMAILYALCVGFANGVKWEREK